MGAPKAKQSSTLRYARLLSFLSITFTLFMLGALGLVYVLESGTEQGGNAKRIILLRRAIR